MKEVKTFIITDFIILLVKVLGGLLCHSYTMIASAIYDVALIIVTLVTLNNKENNKLKGILSTVLGFIIALLGIETIFLSFINGYNKTSFFIILFVLLSIIVRYVVSCFYTNINYQKKKGLLSYGRIVSNIDFINYGVIIGALILNKLSKWVNIFKYADNLGVIILSLLVIIKGVKIIINGIKFLEDKEEPISDEYKEEITSREEIKKLETLEVTSFGGVKKATCNIVLKEGISMVDVNSFVVTLQDYLLKIADVVKISLVSGKTTKAKPKVRSLKQDARNSRSGNSKTNTKKKNTKKKNKKR